MTGESGLGRYLSAPKSAWLTGSAGGKLYLTGELRLDSWLSPKIFLRELKMSWLVEGV